MTKSEAVEHLKNSTVKIDNASRTGTGFFIADKLIATCYHNIKGHAKDELSVYWQGEAYAVKNIEINQEDDLALLEITIDKKHPILQIDESVEVGDDCQSFGYSTKNGDVITFKYEGKDGDSLLKFKEGLFQSGLSGGAILNFRTHKICGIVKSKRDNTESVALGGRGISISKLFGFERLEIDDNGSIFSKEMFKNWVWTSSVESAVQLQLSILALVETLIILFISFILLLNNIYIHIVVGLIISPFFFLRTEKSKKEALVSFIENIDTSYHALYWIFQGFFILIFLIELIMSFNYINMSFNKSYNNYEHLKFIILLHIAYLFYLRLPFALFFGNLLKVIFTFKNLSIKQLLVIPSNWFHITFLIDSKYPLEVIPGIIATNSDYRIDNFFKKTMSQIESKSFIFRLTIGFSLILGVIFTYINSKIIMLTLRYLLKSTAWIYLPLIWLIQPQDKQNLTTRLKIESKNFIAYLMFFYSLIVVFVFTLLPLIFPHTPLGVYLQTLAIPPTLKTIFFAYEFNLWHLTRFFSAVITIVFMFSFTKILIMREVNPSYGDFWGAKLLSLRTVRSVLTLVTLGFTAYHILGLLPDDFFVNLWKNMKFVPHI